MCGLVGLLRRFEPDAAIDVSSLAGADTALSMWSVGGRKAGAELLGIAESIEDTSRALVDWPGFRTLLSDPQARQRVDAVASGLERAIQSVDARLDDAEVADSEEGEQLARGALLARDVAWRLRMDALANLERARQLLPEGSEGSAPDPQQDVKLWFELWRINLVLNQLERLEVRGRDSGGLGTQFVFSPTDWRVVGPKLAQAGLLDELGQRAAQPSMPDGGVIRLPAEGELPVVLAFVHKVAKEVGELGANVRELREKIAADPLYRCLLAQPGAEVQVLAHTRWASNGVISEPNCHPIANDLAVPRAGERAGGATQSGQRVVLSALNGDVDNYSELARRYAIPADCTTDAKVIPLEIARHLEQGLRPADAFGEAVAGFAGSTAIGSLLSDDPERVFLAQKGSGQAIYVGALPAGGYLFASELYGVVELACRAYKLDGEQGELVVLGAGGGVEGIDRRRYQSPQTPAPLGPAELKPIAIATRDIDRAGEPHYLLKEVKEAPRSVERTLRGKFLVEGTERARFLLGEAVIPTRLRQAVQQGAIRRAFVIGQGTAAVAGQAAAEYMATLLRPAGIEVLAMPATELSGYVLDEVGPETLIVAVSQSGTTTDTNRTVDLARERGALVIGIVNRRGSDLTDKSHGVLYTSDGRDVEMSVASTKAFYCQVVAGYLLGLQLAQLAGVLDDADLAQRLLRLRDLPRRLDDVLERSRERIRAAAQLALRRRHWTVVGSGPVLHAAREIRIKLSELCYKSVPVDTIEDKKHIDLSSEALILVCAAGLSGPAAADAVKEVAIFKAHAASPVVICDMGESRFAEYAEATIPVPASSPEVALLLNTMAGHLFGYETALAIDKMTGPLRQARDNCEQALASLGRQAASPGNGRKGSGFLSMRQRLAVAMAPAARKALRQSSQGDWNAGLSSDEACRLQTVLRLGLGQVPPAELLPGRGPPSFRQVLDLLVSELTHGIDALRRPIDAIKHQAKTVTVGISRDDSGQRREAGPLEQALLEVEVAREAIVEQHAVNLADLDPAVSEVLGVVHYRLSDLDPLGVPTDASRIQVVAKSGIAQSLSSRADRGAALRGTKRMLVRHPRVWVGLGQIDQRQLIGCPLYEDGVVNGLALIHVRFKEELSAKDRKRALRAADRYEDLKCLITEVDQRWSVELLDEIPIPQLLTVPVETLAKRIVSRLEQTGQRDDRLSDTGAVVSPFGEPAEDEQVDVLGGEAR